MNHIVHVPNQSITVHEVIVVVVPTMGDDVETTYLSVNHQAQPHLTTPHTDSLLLAFHHNSIA
jgi:hypothetical protein